MKLSRCGMCPEYPNRAIARYPACDGLVLDCTPTGQLVAQTAGGLIELVRYATTPDVSSVMERSPPGKNWWAKALTEPQRLAVWACFDMAWRLGKPFTNDWLPCPQHPTAPAPYCGPLLKLE